MWLILIYLAPTKWFSVPSHQEYSTDIIFYQTWYDERLHYNDTFETLVLHGNVVSQLWIPDTFFRNSKRTHEYDITIPNQMALIHKDGKVLYSVRYVKPLVFHLQDSLTPLTKDSYVDISSWIMFLKACATFLDQEFNLFLCRYRHWDLKIKDTT